MLDRLGASLCDIAPVHLGSGVYLRGGRPALIVPAVDYDGLTDTMFHMIRQNGNGSTAVLVRMLEVLTGVASCERQSGRLAALRRHADLILGDAERSIPNRADLADVQRRYGMFVAMQTDGVRSSVSAN